MLFGLLLLSLGFFLALSLGSVLGLWFLQKECRQLRSALSQSQAAQRAREEELFDQLLRAKGAKPLIAKPTEERKEVVTSSLDLSEYADRIQERIEAGHLTPAQGQYLMDEARTGTHTQDELDRSLWMSRSGSGIEF